MLPYGDPAEPMAVSLVRGKWTPLPIYSAIQPVSSDSSVPLKAMCSLTWMIVWAKAKAFLSQSEFEMRWSLVLQLKAHPVTTVCSCLRLLGYMAACTQVVQHS